MWEDKSLALLKYQRKERGREKTGGEGNKGGGEGREGKGKGGDERKQGEEERSREERGKDRRAARWTLTSFFFFCSSRDSLSSASSFCRPATCASFSASLVGREAKQTRGDKHRQ